jgi:hypothetical protein
LGCGCGEENCLREGKEVSASFLKKRSKKLLLHMTEAVKLAVAQINRSFLLLFFKKEGLSSSLS